MTILLSKFWAKNSSISIVAAATNKDFTVRKWHEIAVFYSFKRWSSVCDSTKQWAAVNKWFSSMIVAPQNAKGILNTSESEFSLIYCKEAMNGQEP